MMKGRVLRHAPFFHSWGQGMSPLIKGRSSMVLFAEKDSVRSHRVRYVMSEKDTNVELVEYVREQPPEDLLQVNPAGEAPTLVDRDLVLYNDYVICEYLDERYPHPPMMPVDPVSRARVRLTLHSMRKEWDPLVTTILEHGDGADAARQELLTQLSMMTPAFVDTPYFLSEEMTLVDAMLVPILWRLDQLGIQLPRAAAPLKHYAERMFSTPGFKDSLGQKTKPFI